MHRSQELRVLHLLVERGLLTEAQVEAARAEHDDSSDDSVEPTIYGSILDALIAHDAVDRAVVSEVVREVSGPSGPASERANGWLSETEPPRPSFPPSGWDRFECLEFLGRGGMGHVFKARDRRLDRVVALKFLRGDRPELVERFAREARVQAQVEHPNICKVYEVGEVDGSPYIAMQLVSGCTLKEISDDLPLEARVRLMRDVAEAVHAAHRVGLIHRDLKPSNIMVEDDDSGLPHSYVMDFGLARQVDERGQTLTGDVLGSPAYMSPEQARGSAHGLDRRSDVYSLGATMYHLLVGRPPFQGTNPVDTLLKVQIQEPVPLRRHDPNIPADLEAIIMRCLEKSPQRRYDSARDLAEDLERFLDGRPPVLGRQRAAMRVLGFVRRHRRLASAALAVALVGLAVSGVALRARALTAQQQRMAQLFASEVGRIEAVMRVAHLMPLHDIRSDRERVRSRMAWILETLLEVPEPARAPGWYALGRAHLALGEYQAAHDQLRAAWQAGFREPEVAWAYGATLGRMFERELDRLQWLPDPRARATRRLELERRLRDQAVELLRASVGAEDVPVSYVDALVAFYEGRDEFALAAAHETLTAEPWRYEARLLEGEVHAAQARTAIGRGSVDAAAEAFERAREAFAAAIAVAPSDPAGHGGLCRMWRDVVRSRTGDQRVQAVDLAVRSCGRVHVIDPLRTAEINIVADCWLELADERLSGGEDPGSQLAAARAAAEQVLEIAPEDATGLRLWGSSYRLAAAWWLAAGGEDATSDEVAEWTVNAVESLLKAADLAPDEALFHLDLGRALAARADFVAIQGGDASPIADRAVAAFDRAADLGPGLVYPHLEAARTWLAEAGRRRDASRGRESCLEKAVTAAERALAIRPDHRLGHFNLAVAHTGLAECRQQGDGNGDAELEVAIRSLQRCLAVDPEFAVAEVELARAASMLAERQLANGDDPSETLILGRAAAERASRLLPGDVTTQRVLGALLMISAETSPHRRQRFWWGERAVDLLSRLPDGARDGEIEDQLERARRVVREESGRIMD